MNQTADELRTWLSVAAVVVSLMSLYFARLAWRQSNRPIVTAFIEEHASGSDGAAFNLVVANTGNRPALRVRLSATHGDLVSLMAEDAVQERLKIIERNFRDESEIPILRNGEELRTGFGAFTHTGQETWLRYGAQIEISVGYTDLDGKKFKSRIPLKVYARAGFGGGLWND